MRSPLADLTSVHHQNLVGVLDRREAVGDDDGRPPLHELFERFLDKVLALGIDRRGGLVQDEDLQGRRTSRAHEREQLPLPVRERRAPLADVLPVAFG